MPTIRVTLARARPELETRVMPDMCPAHSGPGMPNELSGPFATPSDMQWESHGREQKIFFLGIWVLSNDKSCQRKANVDAFSQVIY